MHKQAKLQVAPVFQAFAVLTCQLVQHKLFCAAENKTVINNKDENKYLMR